jgi:hypothetical protein
MKTLSLLALVSTLSLGFAGNVFAKDAAPQRGAVLAAATSTKAVVVGPVAIHAYSQFSGGALYTVKAVSGTDHDCLSADRSAATVVAADGIASFTVGAGQVACLATTGERSIELLWHAQKNAPVASPVMVASR